MKNTLIVIPHPDDEIVGATFIIKKVLKSNNVVIFFLTNGVISKEDMWLWQRNNHEMIVDKRLKEMLKVIKELKIKRHYIQDIPTRHLKQNIVETFETIKKIIKFNKIDTIFCPAYEGGHQDHDVANFICSKFKKKYNVFEFAEYNYFCNKINCNKFINTINKENIIYLSEEEKNIKRKLLEMYSSEKKNLDYISLEKETYRKIANYDYSLPPHSGRVFYRRFSIFSWHPRVDSDEPKNISNIIINSEINK